MTKKSIFVCIFFPLVILLTFSKPADATDTRIKGMALNSDTRWMVDGLVTYCYDNPAYLTRMGKQVFLEFILNAGNLDYLGGILLKPGNLFNVGIFSGFKVGDNGDAFNGDQYSNLLDGVAPVGLSLTDQYFSILAAFKIRRFSLGLKFGWTGSSYESSSGLKENAHAFIIGLGSYFRIKGRYSLEINPEITIYWVEIYFDVNGNNILESDGSLDLKLPFRLNVNFSSKNILHVMFAFSYLDRSTKDKASNSWERSGYKILVGLSNEWHVSNKVLVMLGLNMDYYKKEYSPSGGSKDENSELFLPLHLGIEGSLPKNWVIRCGLKHNIIEYSITDIGGTEITTLNSGSLSGALGLGLRIGNLNIDWNVDAIIFVSGPHFISGNSNNFSTDFAISYKFGGR